MPPPDLPDDPRDWPSDPYALLGVDADADDDAIRRAYTRLIRRFKPEHHPAEFARIRDAYDACRQRTFWFRPSVSDDVSVPASDPVPSMPAPVPNRIDAHWATAIAGNLAAAYGALQEIASREPVSSEVALRLYWLLAIDPKLDPGRSRHDWLARALLESKLGSDALELYRRELEADAGEALASPYMDLLRVDAPPSRLIAAARVRLAAAGRTGRYSHIDYDLKQLKDRLGPDHDSDWLAIIVAVFDWTASVRPNAAFDRAAREIVGLKHLELSHAYHFDRMDRTLHWSAEATAAVDPEVRVLVEVLRIIWASYGSAPRAALAAALGDLASAPLAYLRSFDQFFAERGPALGAYAEEVLSRQLAFEGPGHSPAVLRGFARRIVGRWSTEWFDLRGRFTEMAIREGILPDEWAAACAADPATNIRAVAGPLHGDPSFRLVVLASLIVRG
jgi:hypothetical protein